MKNIKVTYKYISPSRILGNLISLRPDDTITISVHEFRNLSEETASKVIEELNKLEFVMDYIVTNSGVVDKELSKARDS